MANTALHDLEGVASEQAYLRSDVDRVVVANEGDQLSIAAVVMGRAVKASVRVAPVAITFLVLECEWT